MSEIIIESIFAEMMAHPILFTHMSPKKVLILGDENKVILKEVLKHPNVVEVYHDFSKLKANTIDVCIHASTVDGDLIPRVFSLLHPEGILAQQSVSPFEINPLKSLTQLLQTAGFSDLQLLSFPKASGWTSLVLAKKVGMLKRLREKMIFNKSFKTNYYNFDIHKAAAVLPEFMRNIEVL